jgi:hypothetical protein
MHDLRDATPHSVVQIFPTSEPRPCSCRWANLQLAFSMLGKNIWLWVAGFIVAIVLPNALILATDLGLRHAIGDPMLPRHPISIGNSILLTLCMLPVSSAAMLLQAGYMRMIILRMRGYSAGVGEIFRFNGQILPLLGWGLLCAVLYSTASWTIWLLLPHRRPEFSIDFFIPQGVFYSLALVFNTAMILVAPIIIDQRAGLRKAIALSLKLMAPRLIPGIGLLLLANLFFVLGFIGCYVGILFTGPLVYLLAACCYSDCFLYQSSPTNVSSLTLAIDGVEP